MPQGNSTTTTKDPPHVIRTVPDGEEWIPRPPRALYQNVMWPMGSTPDRPCAHASSIIKGPLEDGIQTLYSTFHWGPGEGQPGTGHGLVKITYEVDKVVEWMESGGKYPEDIDDFDPYEPNDNPLFSYEGPFLIGQMEGRCHGNSSPYWDEETGRFHLWMTTFVPRKTLLAQGRADEPLAHDRRIFYKYSDDPEPWTDLSKWSQPVEWSDRVGLWSRAPPVIVKDGDETIWLIAHNDEETYLPEYGNKWSVRFAVSRDKGKTWEFSRHYGIGNVDDGTGSLDGLPRGGIIQPTVVQLADGSLYCLCRSRRGCIVEMRSAPGGRLGLDWTTPRDTVLPNNNSGISQVRLVHGKNEGGNHGGRDDDGDGGGGVDHLLLIYNPTRLRRTPLSIAESLDGGRSWRTLFDLRTEGGELSYPWILQTPDGLVHCCYTLHRMVIAHDVFLP